MTQPRNEPLVQRGFSWTPLAKHPKKIQPSNQGSKKAEKNRSNSPITGPDAQHSSKKVSGQPVGDEVDPDMYLKAACSEIPVSRQRGGPRLDRCPSIQQRQGAGTRVYPPSPTSCLPGSFEACKPREQQTLDELLQVRSPFFQVSAQPSANMVYRWCQTSSGSSSQLFTH
ncbi:hypothetical protein INR49_010618 [Caranx melampygus]|nr:hypothetical protein INR49_010618 [Caranx melampygus]